MSQFKHKKRALKLVLRPPEWKKVEVFCFCHQGHKEICQNPKFWGESMGFIAKKLVLILPIMLGWKVQNQFNST